MPMYRVVTPLRNGGPDPVAPGDPVKLDAVDGDALAAIGAVTPMPDAEPAQEPAPAPPAPPPPAPIPASEPKPLSAMKRPELVAEAAKVGVTLKPGLTNKQAVALIEAARVGAAS